MNISVKAGPGDLMSTGNHANNNDNIPPKPHTHQGDGTAITSLLDATTNQNNSEIEVVTASALSDALRQHVMVLQLHVGELFTRPQRIEQKDDQENDGRKTPAPGASPEPIAEEGTSKKRRPPGRVREIPHRKPQKLQIDYPEDSDEGEPTNKPVQDVVNAEKGQSDQDVESNRSSECESESSEDVKEELLAEQWDIQTARETVQQLMGQLNTDNRVDVLEGLQTYYGAKLLSMDKDSATINRVEVDAQSGMDYINGAASELNQIINDREIKTYMLLWRYYKSLQGQLAGIDADFEEKRLQQVRELLVSHARESVKKNRRGSKALPEGVKPCDMLLVVSEVQKDCETLKATIELDTKKKKSYEYTLEYIMRNGLSGINNDNVAGSVIQDLRQWMQQSAKVDKNAQKLANQIEGKEVDYQKLLAEIDALKFKLNDMSGELGARKYQRERQAQLNDAKIEEKKEATDASQEPGLATKKSLKGAHALMLSNFASPTEGGHMLFNETTSKEFENDFQVQQEENLQIEKQLQQFEELEALARSAVATLEDGTRKFVEVANAARKNIVVSVLPQEAECEDTKVLQDLKGFDEQLDKRQEDDHLAEMKSLENKEAELCFQLSTTQKELDAVMVKIAQEQKKKMTIMAETEAVRKEQKDLNRELQKLNLINPQEEQEKLNQILDENEELQHIIDGARYNITEARKRVEMTTQAFSQSREVATKMIMAKKKQKLKLKTAVTTFGAIAHAQRDSLVGHEAGDDETNTQLTAGQITSPMEDRETARVETEENLLTANDHSVLAEDERMQQGENDKCSNEEAVERVAEDTHNLEAVERVPEDKINVEAVERVAEDKNSETERRIDIGSNVEADEERTNAEADIRVEGTSNADEDKAREGALTETPELDDRQSTVSQLEGADQQNSTQPNADVSQSVEEQPDAAKARIDAWKQKLGLSPKEKIPERFQKILDQEQRDNKLAAQLKTKSAELNRQIEAIEDWVRKSKDMDIKQVLEAEEQKIEEDVPPEVLELRQQTKKQKKTLQHLRMHWYNVRELAKRGAKTHGGGKEAAELRLAILRICEDALGYNRDKNAEADDDRCTSPTSPLVPRLSRRTLSASPNPGGVRNSSVFGRLSHVSRKSSTRESRSARGGRTMRRTSTEPDLNAKFLGPQEPVLQARRSVTRKGTFS